MCLIDAIVAHEKMFIFSLIKACKCYNMWKALGNGITKQNINSKGHSWVDFAHRP